MEQKPLSIKDTIQISPETLFSLGTKYNRNFNLCELGILYLLNRYFPDEIELKMSQDGIQYFLISVNSIIEWFNYWEIYSEKTIRSSISKLVHCGAITMPRGYKFNISDNAFWFFETEDMYSRLDPYGYMNSKSFTAYFDIYSSGHSSKATEHIPGPSGWVYCFYNSATGYSKIGITQKIPQRKYSLECSNGIPLELIVAMRCSDYRQCERKLHTHFSEYRKTGEWFSLDENTRVNIKKYFEDIASSNGYVISEWKEAV